MILIKMLVVRPLCMACTRAEMPLEVPLEMPLEVPLEVPLEMPLEMPLEIPFSHGMRSSF